MQRETKNPAKTHFPWTWGLLLAIGGLALLAACDSGGADTSPSSFVGQWQTTIETDTTTYDLTLTLQTPDTSQTGPRVTGEGELVGEDTWAFQIPNGIYTDATRSLSLTLRFNASPWPLQLEGTVGEDYEEITAEISGGPPRFESRSVALRRP